MLVALAPALARTADGQVPVVTAAGDSAARRLRLDVVALHPGEFVYQTTLERDASTSVVGTRTVSVSLATYAGTPAWLLLETRVGDGIAAADSLMTEVATLRPRHWSSVQGSARLVVDFRADSAFGATTAPPGRRSIAVAAPSGTLISGAMLETVLRLLPLNRTWEDSTNTMSVSLAGDMLLPTRLSVIGEDRVRVPGGTFDCWVVAVHADTGRGLYWVTKQDPIVVRSALDLPAMGGAQLVSALTRIAR